MKNSSASRHQGMPLRIFLASYIALDFLLITYYYVRWNHLAVRYPARALFTLASLCIARMASIILIYLWKRAGVILFLLTTLIAMTVDFKIDLPGSFIGITGVFILLILIWKDWQRMDKILPRKG